MYFYLSSWSKARAPQKRDLFSGFLTKTPLRAGNRYAEKTNLSGRGKYVIMEKLVSEKLWTQVSLFSKNAN